MAPKGKAATSVLALRNSLRAKAASHKKRETDDSTSALAATLAEINSKLDAHASKLEHLSAEFGKHAENTEATFEAMAEVLGDIVADPESGEVRPSVSTGTQTRSMSQFGNGHEVLRGSTYRDVVERSTSASSLHIAQARANPPVHLHAPRRDAVLSVKECMTSIDSFYGNSNKKAEVVDASQLIAFNSWFEAARWKLDAARLSSCQQVTILCQKLQGAILLSFMTKFDTTSDVTDVADLKSKLQGLFAESAVHYTDLALNMNFSANSMVANIQTFHTYLQNSSFSANLDHNEFLYSKLRAKMTAVNPNILIQAASEYQRNLDSTADFPTYVQQAIQIAHHVQVNSPKREAKTPHQGPPSKKSKTRKTANAESDPPSRLQGWAKLSDEEMLRKVNRCTKCGWSLRAGQHVKDHDCDPPSLAKRVAGIRSDLGADKDPNRKVNFAPKSSK